MRYSRKKTNVSNNPSYRIISLENPTCYAAEAYRRIKVSIDSLSVEREMKVIQIVSATPGDGKTTTLLNVAMSYAESGKRVILLDLDLRKSKIHRAFKQENVGGITDYLTGNIEKLSDVIKHSNYKNVDFICAGPSPIRPTSLLSLEKLTNTINILREQYDIILVDEPPVLVASDCLIASKLCDGAIFQISQRNTEKSAVKEAIRILNQNSINILGCVYSEVETDADSYTYKYKYKYKY